MLGSLKVYLKGIRMVMNGYYCRSGRCGSSVVRGVGFCAGRIDESSYHDANALTGRTAFSRHIRRVWANLNQDGQVC